MQAAESDGDKTLAQLGEAAVLSRVLPKLPTAAAATLGPGDDCAVVEAPDGRFVVTTDMMVEGPDFHREWSTPEDLGFKAAASNLSDVAAMGAKPTALLVALAAPADLPAAFLDGFARGMTQACAELAPGCGVVGGDLSTSRTLVMAITALGDLEGREPVLRSGARVGDVVALSGRMGCAAAGLELLFAEARDAAGQPAEQLARTLRTLHPAEIASQLRPLPPIADGKAAALAGASAMMDVSDGLSLDASRLAEASGVGISFNSEALGDDPLRALRGGEDHALLATFPPNVSLPGGFRAIGLVVAGAGIQVDGRSFQVSGWDPYDAS